MLMTAEELYVLICNLFRSKNLIVAETWLDESTHIKDRDMHVIFRHEDQLNEEDDPCDIDWFYTICHGLPPTHRWFMKYSPSFNHVILKEQAAIVLINLEKSIDKYIKCFEQIPKCKLEDDF